jgi:hypothetical protein
VANVKVTIHKEGIIDLLKDQDIKSLFTDLGSQVAAEAQSTADEAQGGAGGNLYGYAESGFTAQWQVRGTRPRMIVKSNSDGYMALRVQLASQKKTGIMHLRRALYKFTKRGG